MQKMYETHTRNKAITLTFLAFFTVNFILKLSLISKGPYHGDCLGFALQAEKILKTHQMHYLQGTGLPLTAILGALFVLWGKLFNISDPVLCVNLMSVFIGSLTAALLFWALIQKFSYKTSFLSTLFFTLNPLLFALSTFGNSHTPALLFFVLSMGFLFIFANTQKPIFLILFSLNFSLMGASRLQDFIVAAIPIIIYFLLIHKNHSLKTTIKNIFISTFVCTLILCVFYYPLILKNLTHQATQRHTEQNFQIHFFQPLKQLNYKIFLKTSDILILYSAPMAFFSLFGFFLLFKKDRNLFFFVLWLFLFPLIFFAPLPYARPRFFTLPCIAIMISASFFFLHQKRFKTILLFFAFLTFILPFNHFFPILKFRSENALLSDYFKWIKTKTEEGAFVSERDHHLYIRYYSQRTVFNPPPILYKFNQEKFDKFIADLDNKLANNKKVYITFAGLYGHPDVFQFAPFILDNYNILFIGTHLQEDWHSGCLKKFVFANDLYRIYSKRKIQSQ